MDHHEHDRRPTARDLAEVAAEVLPRPRPSAVRTLLAFVGRAMIAVVSLAVAVVVLPGPRFAAPRSWLDMLLVAAVVGAANATLSPGWQRITRTGHGMLFGATVLVLDVALLRILDVAMGARFGLGDVAQLTVTAALVALPVAIAAVIDDVLGEPDEVSIPP